MIDASAASFRRYSPDSVRFADAKPSSFADLQPGDTVRALGDKNEDGTHLKAEEVVSGAFETIAGTVDSVDPATGEVHITNLQTKKPVVVRTNQNSLLRRLDPIMAAMLARRLRPDAASAVRSGHARALRELAAPGAGGRPEGAPQGGPGGFRGGLGGPGGRRGWRSPADARTDAAAIARGTEEGRRGDRLQFEESRRFRRSRPLRLSRAWSHSWRLRRAPPDK